MQRGRTKCESYRLLHITLLLISCTCGTRATAFMLKSAINWGTRTSYHNITANLNVSNRWSPIGLRIFVRISRTSMLMPIVRVLRLTSNWRRVYSLFFGANRRIAAVIAPPPSPFRRQMGISIGFTSAACWFYLHAIKITLNLD